MCEDLRVGRSLCASSGVAGTGLQDFVDSLSAVWQTTTADGEQRLEWTQLYNDYTAIFDVQLESFVEERGTTVPEFLAAAQGEEGLASLYISLILASTEYDAFVGMMAEACEQMKEAAS